MSISEKKKEILGGIIGILIIIGILLYNFGSEKVLLIVFFIGVMALVGYFLNQIDKMFKKTIESGLMGALIIVLFAIYNPDIKQFNIFIKDIVNQHNKVEILKKHDFVFFTFYSIKIKKYIDDEANQIQKSEKTTEKLYLGILKNFWEVNSWAEKELEENKRKEREEKRQSIIEKYKGSN